MHLRPFVPAASLCALVLAAASCAPPPPADTPADMAAPHLAVDAPRQPPAGYEPVPAPEGMLATVRMGSPAADLAALGDFVTPSDEFGRLLLSDPGKVVDFVLGSLSAHIDVASPINALFFDEERGSRSAIVMSFPLRDFHETWHNASFDFSPETEGRILVTPRPRAGRAGGLIAKKGLSCGIFRGGAPLRKHLVCAANREKLDRAGPYLARTVSLLPARPGLRMEIPESQIRKSIDQSLKESQSSHAASPGELEGMLLGQQVGLEWAADMRDMAMDVQIGPAGVTAGFDLHFRSLRSPFSLAMVGSARRDIPPAFWRVPSDANLAFYYNWKTPGSAGEAPEV